MPRGGPVYRHEVVKAPSSRDSVVASSRVYSNGPGAQKIRQTGRKTRSDVWQAELWDFYDIVPEYRFGCSWVGNLLSKAVLTVHYRGKPTTNQHALDALASLFGGPEGQTEMLRLLGINFTVAGEAYIVGRSKKNGDDEWSVASAVEVTGADGGGVAQIKVEGEALGNDDLAIRLWKAHPRKSNESDSPSRALLPVLTQLVEISQVISAQASSRLTSAGILWVPTEMELPAVATVMDDGDDTETEAVQPLEGAAGLNEMLIRIASKAIADRGSAAANVPLVVSVAGEFLEKIQKTDFWSGFDEHAKDLREEAVRRISIGMDMPPEIITGTGDMNHWGSWSVEEAAIKIHSEPLLEVITASLSTGYLQPLLAADGVEDAEGYTFEADTSGMRVRPNRSKEALELWDRGAINVRTLLIENGFDPDTDQPDEKERIFWFLAKVAGGSTSPDQVAAALEKLGVLGIPGAVGQTTQAPQPRSLKEHPTRDLPDEVKSEQRQIRAINASAGSGFVVDGLVLATEVMVYRALERAGNRLKREGARGAAAADLYLSVPHLSRDEAETLLSDAWSCLDRFDYPNVSNDTLRKALHSYTLTLLRMQKPHTRQALARHLMMELAEEQEAS